MNPRIKLPVINHLTWNALIDKIGRRLPVRVVDVFGSSFSHPWSVIPFWVSNPALDEYSPTDGDWHIRIVPGFVNGLAAEINTFANFATERTLERIELETGKRPEGSERVTALLTEFPSVKISAGVMRVIGAGAEPTSLGVSAETGKLSVEFEPIPKFFEQYGVSKAADITGGLDSGTISIVEDQDIKPEDARALLAFDIALYYDRMAFKVDSSNRGNPLLDGFTVLLSYSYGRSSAPNPRPYIKVLEKFTPPPTGSISILEGEADPEFDTIKIATVYLLSGQGVSAGGKPNAAWIPFTENNLFWNLAHAKARPNPPLDSAPLSVRTGLAGGLGDIVNNQILSPLNDAYAEAALQINAKTLEGTFWSL